MNQSTLTSLSISVKAYPPYVSECILDHSPIVLEGGLNCRSGPFPEILHIILKTGRFRYVLRNYTDLDYHTDLSLPNKTTVLSLVKAGVVDMDILPTIYIPFYTSQFDIAYPIASAPMAFLVKRPEIGAWQLALRSLKPFDLSIWLSASALILCLITMIIVMQNLRHVNDRRDRITVWMQMSLIVGDETTLQLTKPHQLISQNIILILFSYFVLFIKSLYQGLILCVLLFPIEVKPFETLAELLDALKAGRLSLADSHPGN